MDEQALRALIAEVKVGKLSRRTFVRRMVALGLTAPMASQMLNYCGVAQAQTKFVYVPTKRGGGGALELLWWQSPTSPPRDTRWRADQYNQPRQGDSGADGHPQRQPQAHLPVAINVAAG